jgi:hypothetical protein
VIETNRSESVPEIFVCGANFHTMVSTVCSQSIALRLQILSGAAEFMAVNFNDGFNECFWQSAGKNF